MIEIHLPRYPPACGPAAFPGRPVDAQSHSMMTTTPDEQIITDWPLLHYNGDHDFVTPRKSGVLISSHRTNFTGRLQTPSGVTFGAARGRHERRQSQSAAAPPPPPRSGGTPFGNLVILVIMVTIVISRPEYVASASYLSLNTSMPPLLQDITG